jgi:hypothetical protein
MTESMTTERYRGFLALHDHGEGMDILFLDHANGDYGDPLAGVIEDDIDRYGRYLSVRYWTANEARGDDDMIEGVLRELDGEGEAKFRHRYSEITGYMWTDEDINVGGHDLQAELQSQAGRYCLLEIGYSKDPQPSPVPDGTDTQRPGGSCP